jgi:pimeloyl-ACP methyl ester carboxylesterase
MLPRSVGMPGSSAATREPGAMGSRRFVELTGGSLEVEVDAGDPELPTLVFLHEGLGSIELWRSFPRDVVAASGGPPSVIYSRHGHGRSDPADLPRPVDYMHREASIVLPELLRELGVERPVLVGHSDGASIALLYAGGGHDVAGLVCIAPHVFVEDESVAGIEAARVLFETTDTATRMARYHDDPDSTFRGWNDVWLSPSFRSWNIESALPAITAPTLVVQGTADQYGTLAQVESIRAGVSGACRTVVVEGAGHAPHLEATDAVVHDVAEFVAAIVR